MTDPSRPDDADATIRPAVPAPADPSAESAPLPAAAPMTPPGTAPMTPPGVSPTIPVDATSPTGSATERYSPEPDPRGGWVRTDTSTASPGTPERWYEPAAPVTPVATATLAPKDRGRGNGTSILAAALLSAVLASGGTVLALGATGALDRPVTVAGTAAVQRVGVNQPVTIDESSATIDVAAKVNPAVVRITTSGDANTDFGVIPETGVGSGVIYDPMGWILTNRHVVEGSDSLQVELNDGRSFTGSVYGIDTLTDLAIVKVDATDLPTAALGSSDELKVGQLVVAIGSPLGTYSNSVTSGIVSAKGRSITTDDGQSLTNLVQTDAAINPGNSGGPLLDANGSIVGINTAIAADSNGIGFAIPIDIAKPIMAQAVAGKTLARPYMGVTYSTITRQLAKAENLPVIDGALIGGSNGRTAVQPGTPAAQAGFQAGDIIVKVDGKPIDGDHPLDATLSQFAPGDTIAVDILRDGASKTLTLTLGTRPAN